LNLISYTLFTTKLKNVSAPGVLFPSQIILQLQAEIIIIHRKQCLVTYPGTKTIRRRPWSHDSPCLHFFSLVYCDVGNCQAVDTTGCGGGAATCGLYLHFD